MRTIFIASPALLALTAVQAAPLPVEGRWIIAVAPCGSAMCGKVEWASEKAKVDASRGTRQLVGTNLLTDLREKKPGLWRGKLFVPDQNLRVSAQITLAGDTQLKVAGCALLGKVCKSQVWSRTEEPLPTQ